MTTFDERGRAEEARFQHDQELLFKVRNRRTKLFGLWLASEHLNLPAAEHEAYAKALIMADFDKPGDPGLLAKVNQDLAAKGSAPPAGLLQAKLTEFETTARQQVMAE